MQLNLGSGDHPLESWINVDVSEKVPGEHIDLGQYPWPWSNDSVDRILASHILEHFDKDGGQQFLLECHRILKSNGRLDIAVPDMDIFIDCRLKDDWSRVNGYHWKDLNHLLGGDGSERRPEQRHRYMYTFESLAYALERAGFAVVYNRDPLPEDTERYHGISLYMTAIK